MTRRSTAQQHLSALHVLISAKAGGSAAPRRGPVKMPDTCQRKVSFRSCLPISCASYVLQYTIRLSLHTRCQPPASKFAQAYCQQDSLGLQLTVLDM
ncbi:hypothetical protein BV20DRAFT_96555 [Pilatotrama ljubarskyi]|nr:hypothetical protein BV20DRAFT_96555 [Pilatotrama ljubarskyi]